MKIGFDAKRAFHNDRGLGNYSRTLLEGLFQYFPENSYHLFTPPYSDKRPLWKDFDPSRVHVHTPETFVGQLLPSVWRSVLLSGSAAFRDLDLYHGLSHELPPLAGHSKTKTTVTIHDLLFLRFPENFLFIDRATYKRKVQRGCQNADRIIAVCEQTKRDLIDFLQVDKDRIDVVYQGCHPVFFERAPEAQKAEFRKKYLLPEEYILYVGALERNKNLINLVKAYSIYAATGECPLVIVGRGRRRYMNRLHTLIKNLGIEDRVSFFETVGFEDIPLFYQCARCFVFPSFFEGFGIPIIEAIASGIPVVTSKGSCFPESGGAGAEYIDPNDPEEIAHSVKRVAEDSLVREQMAYKSQEHIQKFRLDLTTEKLMDVYRKIVNQ